MVDNKTTQITNLTCPLKSNGMLRMKEMRRMAAVGGKLLFGKLEGNRPPVQTVYLPGLTVELKGATRVRARAHGVVNSACVTEDWMAS